MNETMVLPRGYEVASAGEALALPGSRASEVASGQLPVAAATLLRTTYAALEDLILVAIKKRSALEFKTFRSENFSLYSSALLALPQLVRLIAPPHAIERLNREFLCELESDLRENGLSFFGAGIRDQAMFTAWTVRKIIDLTGQIPKTASVASDQRANLTEIADQFSLSALWMRFHLHCLVSSMRTAQPILPGPLDLILDGLRSAVNAYALARRAVDLLVPQPHVEPEPQEWDDEDAALLAEATQDMMMEII